jgi:hypothetical protein
MKARELMKDAPELKTLLDRCLSVDYDIDKFDFFYMQALSERDALRFPGFNPSDGHWHGASVLVAGGYCQRRLREEGYDKKALTLNRRLISASVCHEISSGKTKHPRRMTEKEISRQLGIMEELARIQPFIVSTTDPINIGWIKMAREFIDLYKEQPQEVYENVDFSSPVFNGTRLFLPFSERRRPTGEEVQKLEITHCHDVFPFTAHLIYYRCNS